MKTTNELGPPPPLNYHTTPTRELRASKDLMCINRSTRWVFRYTRTRTQDTSAMTARLPFLPHILEYRNSEISFFIFR
ncbi:hypothetical protein TNCV_2657931 [Trichonephila clavipes]|nr:hypothetical protein TNCV_2657931 [Trichonephila clavipes]